MNSTSPIRFFLLAGLTALVLAVGACGEEAASDPPKILEVEGGAVSSGPDEAIMAATLASALADENMTKTVSSIELGQTVEGLLSAGDNQLDDGSYYDAWLFELGSTTDVEIGMNSAEIDSYLSLYAGDRGSFGTHMGSDDNGGGAPHALHMG